MRSFVIQSYFFNFPKYFTIKTYQNILELWFGAISQKNIFEKFWIVQILILAILWQLIKSYDAKCRRSHMEKSKALYIAELWLKGIWLEMCGKSAVWHWKTHVLAYFCPIEQIFSISFEVKNVKFCIFCINS